MDYIGTNLFMERKFRGVQGWFMKIDSEFSVFVRRPSPRTSEKCSYKWQLLHGHGLKVVDVGFTVDCDRLQDALGHAVRCTADYLRHNGQIHWRAMTRLKCLCPDGNIWDSRVDCPDPDADGASVRLSPYDVANLQNVLDRFHGAIGLSRNAASALDSVRSVMPALSYDQDSSCYQCASDVRTARSVMLLLAMGRMDDISVCTVNAMLDF